MARARTCRGGHALARICGATPVADRSLGRVWSSLDRRGRITADLREGQLQWLAARDACLIDPEPSTCVRRAMLGWIRELGVL